MYGATSCTEISDGNSTSGDFQMQIDTNRLTTRELDVPYSSKLYRQFTTHNCIFDVKRGFCFRRMLPDGRHLYVPRRCGKITCRNCGPKRIRTIHTAIFEGDINSLAYYGVTKAEGDTFRPDDNVSRGEMAAFMKRMLQLSGGGATPFTDIDGSIFKADIEAIYAAGITVGTSPTTYSPDNPVLRGQMATFLARALGVGN